MDAHARTHTLAILANPTAEILDGGQFPATSAGLERAIAWVAAAPKLTSTHSGSSKPSAPTVLAWHVWQLAMVHRGRGNADERSRQPGNRQVRPLDARRIAQAVLPLEDVQLRRPRSDDCVRAALRVLIARPATTSATNVPRRSTP